MRISHIAVALLAFGLAFPSGSPAQGTSPPFSITIDAPEGTAKLGSPLEITITLTNTSGKSALFYFDNGNNPAFDYTFKVENQQGQEPRKTKYFRATMAQDNDQPGTVIVHSFGLRSVKADGTFTESVDLFKLYDLQPGKYSVYVERIDPDTKTIVKSNTITIAVTP